LALLEVGGFFLYSPPVKQPHAYVMAAFRFFPSRFLLMPVKIQALRKKPDAVWRIALGNVQIRCFRRLPRSDHLRV